MSSATSPIDLERSFSQQIKKTISLSPFITQTYEVGGNIYVCKAPPGSSLSDPVWQITRYDSNGNSRKCNGNNNSDNAATDASTVASYQYS